jgi:hypothetical protein
MSSKVLGICVALVTAVFLCSVTTATLFGQAQDGNLVGSILDTSGAAIPNAMVEATNTATGIKVTTTSDATGFYRFNNLIVGTYKISAMAPGLSESAREVVVELNKTTTANINLGVGGVTTEVNVTAGAALIDTTTAHVTNNYSTQLITQLPLAANPVAGGVYNLALTGAGVASSGGVGVGFGPSVGGQRPRNNNFMVEGTDNNRKDITGTVVDIPADSIKEFSVQQNQFNAEFGHSSGGQFNVALRGGGNEFHGTVYEYFQNRKLNAVDQKDKRNEPCFSTAAGCSSASYTKPRFDQSFVGGSIGGPIKKNKLFFFGNWDYNPLGQQSTPGAVRLAPTAQGYTLLSALPTASANNLSILKQYVTAAPVASTTTTVCAVNPGAAPCPAASQVAIPLGTFQIIGPNFQNEYRWLGSVDFTQSDRDQWRGRYIGNKIGFIDTGNGAVNLPVFYPSRTIKQSLISISEFHTFSATLANELRLGYNRYATAIPAGDFKFPGLDSFPNLQIAQDLNLQIGPNPNAPQATKQNTYQLSDNLSWYRGKHELKFGFDGRDLISCSCPAFIQRVRGDYNYTTLDKYIRDVTPDVLAQRNTLGPIGNHYSGNDYSLNFFVNDNWKANQHLTVSAGLRYEYSSVPKSMKEFALNSIADVPGVLTFKAPEAQKTNFAPRIGFAYTPGTSATTAIRGGFGLAYDLIFDNVGTNARPPQATTTIDQTGRDSNTGYLAAGGISPLAQPLGSATAARAATSSYLPDQKLGYAINWNLGVQHSFGKDYTAELRYLGNRGVHLLFQTQLNRAAVVTSTHNLPLFLTAPSQATLDALPLTLAQLNAERSTSIGNPMLAAGFTGVITAYEPLGNSIYHGLAFDLNKRFSNHVLFKFGYTWSHLMDDSTAEVNSTTLSPRRPEDFNNIRKEWANSALDHRHRASFAWAYNTPWFEKSSNPLLQKVVGNWEFTGAWFLESGEFVTPQSASDANLNGDSAGDRVVLNLNGDKALSSGVTALTSVRGGATQTVGYLANNPNAYYIRALGGMYTTSGRNILQMPRIDNFDISIAKAIPFREHYKVEFRGDLYNAFNHPQFTAGRVNRVSSFSHAGETNYLTPGNSAFAKWDENFPSNARQVQLTARITF